jgi:hypothetical protein
MVGRWTHKLTESKSGNESEVTEVVLPCGVTAIAGDAFCDYAMLRSLTIQPGCVTIEGGTGLNVQRQRYEGAMAGCSSLVKAMIPATCATIGAFALSGCSGLSDLAIPSSVTTIGDEALCSCSGLTSVVIPSKVTNIGDSAFYDCSGLTELVIPSSVTSIGDAAFWDCSGVKALTISASLRGIGDSDHDVFYGLTLERVTLVGSPLDPAVVANVEPALAPSATVISAALAGQWFGRFAIAAA